MNKYRKRNRKDAVPKLFQKGWTAGYTPFRYGQKPKAPPKPIFNKDRREHVLGQALQLMREWRKSPFEFEGVVRAGIRSALCMDGYDWDRSDAEAASIVAAALARMHAVRPTWEQGQREYSVPQENCNWCAMEMPAGTRERFCCAQCAKAAIMWRDYETRYKESLIGNSAYRVVARSRTTARPCKHCGESFHPLRDEDDQVFCSQRCFGAYKTRLPERECAHCSKTFRPRQAANTGQFCSPACYYAHGRTERYTRRCVWCSTKYETKSARAIFCSGTCKSAMFRADRGVLPKRLSPPVFDYVFRAEAA